MTKPSCPYCGTPYDAPIDPEGCYHCINPKCCRTFSPEDEGNRIQHDPDDPTGVLA